MLGISRDLPFPAGLKRRLSFFASVLFGAPVTTIAIAIVCRRQFWL